MWGGFGDERSTVPDIYVRATVHAYSYGCSPPTIHEVRWDYHYSTVCVWRLRGRTHAILMGLIDCTMSM